MSGLSFIRMIPATPGHFILEDPVSPASPFERIDLILERDMTMLNIQRVGTAFPFPSDHVGVVASLLRKVK
jgi:hypothetical protein